MYTYLYFYSINNYLQVRRPSRHSSGEIAVIVDAPAVGVELAVRHEAAAAARPATRWRRRTARARGARGPAPTAPGIESTRAEPRLRGESVDTDLGTGPGGRTGAPAAPPPPPQLPTGRRQTPTWVESVLLRLCSPCPLKTIFLASRRLACCLVGLGTVSVDMRGVTAFHRVLVIPVRYLRVTLTILIRFSALIGLVFVEVYRRLHWSQCRNLFRLK